MESAVKAAAEGGLELIAIPVSTPEQLQGILGKLEQSIDALWSVADSTVFSSDRSVEFLLRQTLQYKIPFMGLSPAFVKAGALLALSVDYRDVGKQCGEQTAQILAGRAPSSLPVTTPRKATLYINLNVARTIGVEIPPQQHGGSGNPQIEGAGDAADESEIRADIQVHPVDFDPDRRDLPHPGVVFHPP